MRTIINLPQEYVDALSEISRREKISRAEVIRRAIDDYLKKSGSLPDSDSAFGIWKAKVPDTLRYIDALRTEWQKNESVF
jgi:metal-responsive CopG/Arc/MetJ family transcriptional regulator